MPPAQIRVGLSTLAELLVIALFFGGVVHYRTLFAEVVSADRIVLFIRLIYFGVACLIGASFGVEGLRTGALWNYPRLRACASALTFLIFAAWAVFALAYLIRFVPAVSGEILFADEVPSRYFGKQPISAMYIVEQIFILILPAWAFAFLVSALYAQIIGSILDDATPYDIFGVLLTGINLAAAIGWCVIPVRFFLESISQLVTPGEPVGILICVGGWLLWIWILYVLKIITEIFG